MRSRRHTVRNLVSIVFIAATAFVTVPLITAATAQEKIAFYSYRDAGLSEIYLMNPDGTSQTRLTNNPATVGETEPAISPDGSQIAFVSQQASTIDIYRMNADGTNVTRLTNNSRVNFQPAFSPDGTKIVFVSAFSVTNSEIYVMNADGTNQTRLTNSAVEEAFPSFSPDGSRIVFNAIGAGGASGIYVMNTDGTNRTQLTNNSPADEGEPVFSPDGSRIAFRSSLNGANGNPEIYIMNADGTNQTRLTNNVAYDSSPAFSPDGSRIAFQSDRAAHVFQIYVMNADGTNVTQITNSNGNYDPSWSGVVPNTAPTITAAVGVTRARDAGASNSSIATVNDPEDAENTLSVTVNGGSSATSNGVTVSGIAVSSSGNVTANIAATCSATDASVTLRVTDSGALFSEATLNVGVTKETILPVLSLPLDIVTSLPANSTDTGKVVTFAVSASDNCDPNPTVAAVPASGSTFPVGTTTVNVTATDASGNTATGSFTVTVAYNFAGFFQPIDNLPLVNSATAGSSIPVKFSLSGNKGLNIFAAGYPASQQVDCASGAPVSPIVATSTAGSSSLSYDAATDSYIYVWKTDRAWRGTCQQLIVRLGDGSLHVASFQFR